MENVKLTNALGVIKSLSKMEHVGRAPIREIAYYNMVVINNRHHKHHKTHFLEAKQHQLLYSPPKVVQITQDVKQIRNVKQMLVLVRIK